MVCHMKVHRFKPQRQNFQIAFEGNLVGVAEIFLTYKSYYCIEKIHARYASSGKLRNCMSALYFSKNSRIIMK